MSDFIIGCFNTQMFYQQRRSALLEFHPSISVVPNHRVATHYQAVEEFLPGREKVLGKMCIDMMLC